MDEKLKDIILNYKSLPNKDLVYGMSVLSEDFEKTKEMIIKMTHYLDSTEMAYNNILNEYKNRTKR